jgi:anti-sigma factor RsiW
MKESRFIELLNLYVDQQLTAPEAVELEAELQHNQSRRRTYQQYCRMQKACTQLFEQEQQGAPSMTVLSKALAKADRKVVAFPERRPAWRQRGVFATGLAAMAACVAFVMVRQSPTSAVAPIAAKSSPAAVVVVAEQPAPAVQTVAIPPADPQAKVLLRRAYYSLLPVKQFVPVQVVSENNEIVRTSEEQPNFDWMKQVELSPMHDASADAFVLETNNSLQAPSSLYINQRRPVQGLYERTAFQFQKDR